MLGYPLSRLWQCPQGHALPAPADLHTLAWALQVPETSVESGPLDPPVAAFKLAPGPVHGAS